MPKMQTCQFILVKQLSEVHPLWKRIQNCSRYPDLRVGFYGYRPTLWKLFYDAYGRFYDVLGNALASNIGLDASPGMLRQCFKNLEENARVGLVLGFAENLPFKNEIFDRVLIGGCLGHIALKKRALEEACRVLKPEKTLIVYDQATYLDRISGKVYKTLENRSSELVLTSFRYLFGGHIYIAKFIRAVS